jgi:hypothetical protein
MYWEHICSWCAAGPEAVCIAIKKRTTQKKKYDDAPQIAFDFLIRLLGLLGVLREETQRCVSRSTPVTTN